MMSIRRTLVALLASAQLIPAWAGPDTGRDLRDESGNAAADNGAAEQVQP